MYTDFTGEITCNVFQGITNRDYWNYIRITPVRIIKGDYRD